MVLVDAATITDNQTPWSTYILKDDLSAAPWPVEGRRCRVARRFRSSCCCMEGHSFTALTAVLQNARLATCDLRWNPLADRSTKRNSRNRLRDVTSQSTDVVVRHVRRLATSATSTKYICWHHFFPGGTRLFCLLPNGGHTSLLWIVNREDIYNAAPTFKRKFCPTIASSMRLLSTC